MLRKFYLVPVLALLALLAIPTLAQAQFEAGNWSLELSGSGGNDKDFESGNLAVNAELGYFTSKEFEIGIRQGISWADTTFSSSVWNGSTVIFADYHFDMDRWQPYIGANIGYLYGDSTADTWVAGPEGGVKYFVNSTTFIDARITYEFSLQDGIDEGAFGYGLGIGFRW
jgi:hypothetical protein